MSNYSWHESGESVTVQKSIGKCSASKPGKEGALVTHYDKRGEASVSL